MSCESVDDSQLVITSPTLGTIPLDTTNELSIEGIELGSRLFFDTGLSKNGTVSCGTCHLQHLAFSDAMTLSNLGVSGKHLNRHTPVLQNLAWHHGFFWDGGARDLESQTLGPLTHEDEMGTNPKDLVTYLKTTKPYPSLFRKVFNDTIRMAYIQRALAQYEKTLISDNSIYDQYIKGKTKLSNLETAGLQLFERHCQSCHTPPFFSDHAYHNNGLDSMLFSTNIEDPILGRYRITQDSSDLIKYKTPSLRNISVSAPYMHDGRFQSLDEVLAFYSNNVRSSSTLDNRLRVGGLQLSLKEREELKSFLNTLTDSSFLYTNVLHYP